MKENQDRIRVWNKETSEMMEPATVREMLCMERNVRITEGWSNPSEDPLDPDILYGHLVFMRNTGICAAPRNEEMFDGDLITSRYAPHVYRVACRPGEWWAISLYPTHAATQPLNSIPYPTIVGNVFENVDLVTSGAIIDE